ncbi:MAG: bifunctional 2-C-methyl-D-erythritol 4-phosphate cytidylyltransferase/2-C-methyl-D-erythritol 2,4-cyclodiphosphate synthase [Bauldia sp.]|nr:bifunctional 2-C-methyl-D-erythritol 4-phosphate cytidylyltransferase/2-C-methyl-D-erythritol 2,4-cyclodiphosphate synthase [Bauldia sp.]
MSNPAQPKVAALIVAAGRGMRAGGEVPKQYRPLAGQSILSRSLRPFLDHPQVAQVAVVIHPDDRALYDAATTAHARLTEPVAGGDTRQESVRLGLAGLAAGKPDLVLIHDAARPFVTAAVIDRVIAALDDVPGALPAIPVADTLKRGAADGAVTETVPRDGLFGAQTPQGFHFEPIRQAHEAARGQALTDDAAVAEAAGLAVRLVAGDAANIKLTTAEDIAAAEERMESAGETRVGTGYDVHALGPGTAVTLGGVAIPHDGALVGHSDADVALHALTDALLGAIADGDIGVHFPPSDPEWRGAASSRFLAFAVERVLTRGGAIVHLDLAIVAEAPKIGPHRDAMRARIAEICGIDTGRVAVKATTSERLGFLGRGEGIAAIATATIRLPKGSHA